MSNVVQLIQPLDEARVLDAINEITDTDTEAIVIVTASKTTVGVRSFGRQDICREALQEALDGLQGEGA